MVMPNFNLPGLGNIGNLLGGGVAQAGPKITGQYAKVLSHSDWWDTTLETASGKISCTLAVWTCIGRYKVLPRLRSHFGFGSAQTPDNQGYLYVALYDDTATNSAAITAGKLRLVQLSADGWTKTPVGEWDLGDLKGDANDRNKRVPLPEQVQFPWVAQDSYLEIEVNLVVTQAVVKTAIGTAAGLDIWKVPTTVQIKAQS